MVRSGFGFLWRWALAVTILGCTALCAGAQTRIPCKGESQFHPNGQLKRCVLAQADTLARYALPTNTIVFFDTHGNLTRCTLGQSATVRGQVLPAGTNLFLNFWGEALSFWLSQPTRIQGHLLPEMHDGMGIPLHDNGALKQCWLEEDEVIDGIPCSTSGNAFRFGWHVISMGTERMVQFYDNGRLKQAMLARDIVLQGHPCKKGTVVHLDTQGNFIMP